MSQFDLLIECGYLLDVRANDCKILEKQLIGVQNGQFALIEPTTDKNVNLKQNAKKYIDAREQLLIPGLINGHTHLPMSLFRGLAEDMEFQEWLHQYILPIENKILDEDFVRVGTELSLWESASYGVTTFNDMYYYTPIVADAILRSGLRGIVAQTFMDFPTPDNKQGGDNSEKLLLQSVEFCKNESRVRVSLAPHAPYTCNDETIKKTIRLAEKHQLSIHIHVSETKFEVDESQKIYNKSPVQRLWDLGLMKIPSVFAHGVHLSSSDLDLLQKSNTSVIHNPESNMKIAAGIASIPELLNRNIPVGLGTDGCASNNNLNLVCEMDVAAKLQKLKHLGKGLTAKQILRMATIEGARALHWDDKIGSVEVGKFADFALLKLDVPHMQPTHDLLSHLVYSANGSEIEETYCEGQKVYDRSGPTRLDRLKILKETDFFKNKIAQFLSQNKTPN
ncbi:MAG: amidohydrolase family protein [Bdellovibrionales bacterium]